MTSPGELLALDRTIREDYEGQDCQVVSSYLNI